MKVSKYIESEMFVIPNLVLGDIFLIDLKILKSLKVKQIPKT